MKTTIFYILCFFISFNLSAQSEIKSNEKIATEYMKAYGNWNFDKMKTFYAEDVHFEDPTANDAFGQSYILDGKENVYAFFNGVFKDRFENNKPPYVNFIVEKKFVSGSIAVINATFECIVPTSWFKEGSKEKILISIPFTTILTIKNGLITKHMDYGDYAKYKEQIKAQIN